MRTLLTALLSLVAFALSGCAPPAARQEPAIWRISDADSEIWLYGTVHLLPPRLRWRGPRFEAAFAAADELVLETDASDQASAQLAALAQPLGALPEGERLSQRLSAAELAALRQAADELRLDFTLLDQQQPWLTALQLSYAAALRAGHRPEAGVESVLVREAQARGMAMSYLETPEQQVRILAGLSPGDQLHFLAITLDDVGGGDELMTAMDRAWARGHVDVLEELLDPQWQSAGNGIHNALILRRNRDWTNQIEARLAGSGRVFIAVGAAHLVGEDSVVDLLRERGIDVEGP